MLLMLSCLLSSPLLAQEIAPTVGYHTGGSFGVSVDGFDFDPESIDDAPAYGLTLSFDWEPDTRLDFVYMREQTTLTVDEYGFDPVDFDVTFDYLHFGGHVLMKPRDVVDPYLALTVGITRIALDPGNEVIRPSGAAAVGMDVRISPNLFWRLDGRWWVTFVESSGGIGCSNSGTCVAFADSSVMTQLSASTALVVRF